MTKGTCYSCGIPCDHNETADRKDSFVVFIVFQLTVTDCNWFTSVSLAAPAFVHTLCDTKHISFWTELWMSIKHVPGQVLCFKKKILLQKDASPPPPPPLLLHSLSSQFLLSPPLPFVPYWYSEDERRWGYMQRCWPCVLGVKGIIHVYFILLVLCGIPMKSPFRELEQTKKQNRNNKRR